MERWGDSFKLSEEIFREAGVELVQIGADMMSATVIK